VILITGHPQDALFGIIIVANSGVGVVQEVRAKRRDRPPAAPV